MSPTVRDVFAVIGVWCSLSFTILVSWFALTELARKRHR